ncbi:MAG: hypothetical protein DHS20C11_08370 [Lysobacteraceae bacterium]|nr:MAG: hypothetical protein DHS20C11_08370 [Xanthomonadaceae bacterium]
MSIDKDRELAVSAKSGDAAAFEALVTRYETPVFRYLLARLGHRADAEDALQEAFVSAYRYLQSFNVEQSFRAWIYTIAIREAGRIGKRQTRRRWVERLFAGSGEPVDDTDPVGDHGVWALARQALPVQQFTALWLYYHEQWDVGEVAAGLGRSSSWVKVNLHRARGVLRKRLQPASPALDLESEGKRV